jgi:hypothetical protein
MMLVCRLYMVDKLTSMNGNGLSDMMTASMSVMQKHCETSC